MPWSKPRKLGEPPNADEVIRRLAYHISRRLADPELEEIVVKRAGVSRRTLKRYSAYQPEVLRLDAYNGPRRLDAYYSICLAMGENPGMVLWAAAASEDYQGMVALMSSEVQVRHRLSFTGEHGDTQVGCATVVVKTAGPGREHHDVEPTLSPAA